MAPFMVALRRQKSGGYAARKAIPKDVRLEYSRLYGNSWEEKLNIPPGMSAHEAKAKHGEWLAEIETRIAALRAAKDGQGQPLTRQNAHALAGQWYSWFLAQHETDPRTPKYWREMGEHFVWDVLHPHAPAEYLADIRADPEWEWKWHADVRKEVRPIVAEAARTASFLLQKGVSLAPEAHNLFLDAVEDNLLAAYHRLELTARGDYGPDDLLTSFPKYIEHSRQISRTLSVWALFQAWIEAIKPSPSTVRRWTVVFRTADAQFPDAQDIDNDSARAWLKALPNQHRSQRTVATVWKTSLKTVFNWAESEKSIRNNPFKDIKMRVPRKITERETKAFTGDEIMLILRAALQYERPSSMVERARRWVPWICAYTGARAGEITQLRGSDVFKHRDNYFAKLTPAAGRIKTRKARTVPLHEHLIELGFFDFVQEAGDGPLFYQPLNEEVSSELAQSPAERARSRLGEWVRAIGVNDPEVSPTHGWRYTFKAQAARSGIEEHYRDEIAGHEPSTIGRMYTKPTQDDLAEIIKKFKRYEV